MKIATLLLPCGLLATAVSARAQATLVSFAFTNQSSPTATLTATSLATNLSATTFAVSDGSFTSTNFTTSAPPNTPAIADSGSWSAATPTKYFSFTITPDAGFQANITGISFDYRQTSTGAANFQIDLGSQTNAASGTFLRDSSWYSITPTMTAASFGDTTEIRIYGYGGGTGSFAIDQVTLYGSMSAIPEPSTYAAIAGAISLVGAMLRRRRQRHSSAKPEAEGSSCIKS
jgi:hypothetical protein